MISIGQDGKPVCFPVLSPTRYDQVMSALGGDGYHATTQAELHAAVMTSFAAKRPALINIVIDPHAGVESGNVHSFNTTKAKL